MESGRVWNMDNLKAETEGEADCKRRDFILPREDMRAVDILIKTTRLNDEDHYETGLLWRRDDVQLPNNRRDAEIRLQSFETKIP